MQSKVTLIVKLALVTVICCVFNGVGNLAIASDDFHVLAQKANLKQLFSFTGSSKPCMGGSLIESGNGITWSILNLSNLQSDGVHCSENTWRLIKESKQGISVLKLTDIGVPDSAIPSPTGHDYFKVNSKGEANILWRDAKGIYLTIVNPDGVVRKIVFDKFECKGWTPILDFDGPNPLVIWAPDRRVTTTTDPGGVITQSFCDFLFVARVSLSDYTVEYFQSPWEDTPPSQWSGQITSHYYTEVLGRTLYTCAIRSYPIDSSKLNLPYYFGANLITFDLDSHQMSNKLLISFTDGNALNVCGFKRDFQREDMAVMFFSLSESSKALYRSVNAESNATLLDLKLGTNCNYSYFSLGNFVFHCSGMGDQYPLYSQGILTKFGTNESRLNMRAFGPMGHFILYGSSQYSGDNGNGNVTGFNLTYLDYLGEKSAVYRGNIDISSWCSPIKNDPKCNLDTKVVDAMSVKAVWSNNQPEFFVLSIIGNEVTYSRLINTTFKVPTIAGISIEQSSDNSSIITAQQITDGATPIEGFSWQQSTDKRIWTNLVNKNEMSIAIPTKTTAQSTFYRVSAKNLVGWSNPSPSIEVKGKQQNVIITKKTTITCTKGKLVKKVTALIPSCPSGYKKA